MSEPFPQMKLDAYELVRQAFREHRPSKVFVLFSGGNDSTVLAAWAKRLLDDKLDAAVFIDTGTAIPSVGSLVGVRDFVEDFCESRAIPLIVLEAGDAYARMCETYGVPGPGAHLYAYVWLKERQLDALLREVKEHRSDRVMLLSGVRRAESRKRMGHAVPIRRDGSSVWVNPLIDWTDADMQAYRLEHGLPTSDVAALLHRSGECNCGAFASEDEREDLRKLFPEWFDRVIAPLEEIAQSKGLPHRWGERWQHATDDSAVGPLCHGCAGQQVLEVAA